jgi:hypothetical protein
MVKTEPTTDHGRAAEPNDEGTAGWPAIPPIVSLSS